MYDDSHEVLVVNCDTRSSEHSDNYRFSTECEKWFGKQITYIRNEDYATVDDVFDSTRYMSGVAGARCTTELKKIPRLKFAAPDDIHVFGFTSNERSRIANFKQRNPELLLKFVLDDLRITKAECYYRIEQAGIALPAMYKLGFDNNNCPGCVKAQSPWYWSMTKTHFPEVFKRRCDQSRALGVKLVKLGCGTRIFLDELPNTPYAKDGNPENLSCGPECGQMMML